MISLYLVDRTYFPDRILYIAKDWTEHKEQKKVFWIVFALDRYISFGSGVPIIINNKDVSTCCFVILQASLLTAL
jgi:hypothetical protein